jgi:hypothetical protein
MVNGKVPGEADEVVTILSVEVNEGAPEAGLKEPVTPAGAPAKDSMTLCADPDTNVTLTVKTTPPPGVTVC